MSHGETTDRKVKSVYVCICVYELVLVIKLPQSKIVWEGEDGC